MSFEHNEIVKDTTKANTNLKPTSKNLAQSIHIDYKDAHPLNI